MRIKSILLPALIITMIGSLLSSCSKEESADARDMLATVPADASFVVVANVHSLLEKAGCKVDGTKITPSDDVTGLSEKITDPTAKAVAIDLLNGNSGIDPTLAMAFGVGYYKYISGIAADPAKFKETVEKATKAPWTSQDGIDISGNTAISGNRFWINTGSGSIDPKEVKHFTTLSESQSFLSKTVSESLVTIDKDIEGWGNIAGIINASEMNFQDRASIQVAIQTLFEDPADITFSLNFEKGKMLSEGYVLNSKGKTAKYLFPTQEIDLKTVDSIGGTADAVIAVAIPAKLIEQLQKDTDSKSPSMLGMVLPMISSVDGTVAVAFNDQDALKGIITTNGKNTAALTDFLKQTGVQVQISGNNAFITKGNLSGKFEVSKMSEYFKGAVAGVSTAIPDKEKQMRTYLDSGALTLHAYDGGLKFKITLLSGDNGTNFLESLVKKAGK